MFISLIRTLILYIVVTIAVRLMGKRQVGELQNSELVITLLISNLAAIPMQETGTPLTSGLIPILTLVVCEILISAGMMKSMKFRNLICGHPVVLIKDGVVDEKQMRKLRFTVEDLSEELRLQSVFNIDDVEFAALETNGKLSVMRKAESAPPSAKDLNLYPKSNLAVVLVSDGVFCEDSTSLCGHDRAWVDAVLEREHCPIENVFLMTADRSNKYHIIKKDNTQIVPEKPAKK